MDASLCKTRLFPKGALVSESHYLPANELTTEFPNLETVSPTRRRAFATGRELAQRALKSLGSTNPIVGMGTNNEPLWPHGFTGSISHKKGVCIVVVARTHLVSSLGIDLERRESLDRSLWAKIATDSELSEHDHYPHLSKGEFVNVLFSVKEAVFKCQAPLTGINDLGFRQVKVSFNSPGQTYVGRLVNLPDSYSDSACLGTVAGKFFQDEEWVITSAFPPLRIRE